LPLKKLAQEFHRIGNSLQRKAQIGGHLPHRVVAGIGRKGMDISIQGVGGFPSLEKLFCPLNLLCDFGPIHSLGRFCHGRSFAE